MKLKLPVIVAAALATVAGAVPTLGSEIAVEAGHNVNVAHEVKPSARELDKTADPPSVQIGPPYDVVVQMDRVKNNVGDLVGPGLYHCVYQAMMALCPQGAEACLDHTHKQTFPVNGWYNGNHISQGTLELWIEGSNFRGDGFTNNPSDKIRLLLIGTVAAAIQAQSEEQSNCYSFDNHRLCNIPGIYNIPELTYGGPNIRVFINSPTNDGNLHCRNAENAIHQAINTLVPGYEDALKNGRGEIHTFVRCCNPGDNNCIKRRAARSSYGSTQ